MNTLDLDDVRAFVLISDLQSFTRAADVMGTTQSAISLKLKRLEGRLERKLIERTPRVVRLSSEGVVFLVAARELLTSHERAVGSFAKPPHRLIVGISQLLVGLDLPLLLRRLYESDPTLLVELRVAGSGELLKALDDAQVDAVVGLRPEDDRRRGEVLYEEEFWWVGSDCPELPTQAPVRLATQGPGCRIRTLSVRALDAAKIPWIEVFVGNGAALVGAAGQRRAWRSP